MISVPVYGGQGDQIGAVEVDESRFGRAVRGRLLKDVLIASEAAHRSGTAATKERGDVVGRTGKPWRQKGTGNARAGSVKSPIWRGGGTIFGPHPRSFSQRIPKKARKEALKSALLLKFRGGQVKVLKELVVGEPKTKVLSGLLTRIGAEDCLLVVSGYDKNLWLSARNLPGVDVVTVDQLDARGVASRSKMVLTDEAMAVIGGGGEQ